MMRLSIIITCNLGVDVTFAISFQLIRFGILQGYFISFLDYVIFAQYVFPVDSDLSELARSKRISSCTPTVEINDCPPSYDMYVMMTYQFTANVTAGCSNSILTYEWELVTLQFDYKKPIKACDEVFIIPELSAMHGKALITLKVTEVMVKLKESDSAKCYVEYQKEPPVPILKGGDVLTIAPNITYVVDATTSINFGGVALKPIWSVKCTNHSTCSTTKSFVCPEPDSKTGLVWSFNTQKCANFKISLKLEYEDDPDKYPATLQTLNTIMDKKVETAHLECIVNCISAGYMRITKGTVGWRVNCDNNCAAEDKDAPDYQLEIKDAKTNKVVSNENNSGYYKDNRIIIVYPDVLEIGKNYVLVAWIRGRTKSESIGMNILTYLASQNTCTIDPKSGVALETVFKIDCSNLTPKSYMYRIDVFQPSMDTGVLVMQSSARIFTTQLLATDKNISIEMTYAKTLYTLNQHLDVTVKAKEINVEESLNELKKLRNSNMIFKKVLISESLLEYGAKKLDKKENFRLQAKVLKELSQVTLDNPYAYKGMSHMVKNLKKTPFTIAYADTLRTFCNGIREAPATEFDLRYQDKHVEGEEEIEDVENCLEEDLKASATLDESFDADLSDGRIMEEEGLLTENYPNYHDEFGDDIAQEAEDASLQNKLNLSKQVAESMELGRTIEYYSKVVNKYRPIGAYTRQYRFKNCQGSIGGTYKYTKPFPACLGIVSSAITKGYVSYLVKNKDIASTVVDISTFCVDKNNLTTTLNVPIHINFYKVAMPILSQINTSLTFTANLNEWTFDYLNEKMNIHRLDAFLGDEIFVEFGYLTPNAKLKILVSKNIRPNIFTYNKIYVVDVADEKSWKIHPIIDTLDGDCWVYIGVLIHEDMLKGRFTKLVSVGYNINFNKKSCIIWDTYNREWDPSICKLVNATNSSIQCFCDHSSVYGARSQNMETVMDPYNPLTVNLELKTSYIIFYFVASVFAFYCITFCFVIKRGINTADIYFLADNLKNDLYSYLIIIKSGDVSNTGTTSNIMISIFGTLYKTKAHVLNYPDPDNVLLQKDTEQWFVLAVDKYLGQIVSIDLWFDSSGYRPSWYCESIRIIDLQKHDACYFQIQSWLDILHDQSYLTVYPLDENSVAWNNKILSNFIFHIGAGHTWNLFSKAHDRDFTYTQRITILLSQILNVYSVVLLIMGTPELRLRDNFSTDSFEYTPIILIGISSGLISFLFNIVFVVIFRHSTEMSSTKFILIENLLLPKWLKSYAWAFLIINIGLSLIFLIIFGFWVPRAESMQWVASTITGLVVNIFIFESIFISLHQIFFKYYTKSHLIVRKSYQFKDIIQEIENQRKTLYNVFGELLLRPYLRHLYKRLPQEILVEKKLWYTLKLDVSRLFRDFIIFIIYYIIIYILFIFTQRQNMININNKRLNTVIGHGNQYTGFPLEEIKNYNHIYDYIEFTVIPAINGIFWYGDWKMETAGSMSDFSSKVIGIAQVRQQRADFEICKNQPIEMNISDLFCHYANISTSNHSNQGYFRDSVWIYQSALQTNLPVITGALQSYDGGGFLAKFGRTQPNSQFVLEYLKRRKWIDINTKVVVIDFWSYNAFYNLFSVVQIIIERSETGLMLPYLKIFSAHLLHIDDIIVELFYFILVLMLGCVMTVIILTQISNIYHLRAKYFKEFWHYFDCALIIVIVLTIFGFIERSQMVKMVITTLASVNNNDFVLYFTLVRVSEILVFLSSLAVCLATLRLWKYLRFWKVLRTFERTIVTGALSIFIIVGSLELVILAYSGAGHILFGARHPCMITVQKANAMLLVLFLGITGIDPDKRILKVGYVAQIFKTSYMFISLMFKNILITIILIHLRKSKEYFSNTRTQYTIKEYVMEQYNYFSELFVNRKLQVRLRGGGVSINSGPEYDSVNQSQFNALQLIYPKAEEHRYANSINLSHVKLRTMTTIATNTLNRFSRQKSLKLHPMEHKAMASILVELTYSKLEEKKTQYEKNVVFYTQNAKYKKVKVLFDGRLLDMEYVVKRLVDNAYFDPNREDNRIRDILKFSKISNHLHSTLQCIENIKFFLNDIEF